MPDIAIARALHILAIVVWIGGVAMVTTVLLPALRRQYPPAERLAVFHVLERRFAAQARAATLLAGATGFYMAWRLQAWYRFRLAEFWWMHAMVLIWLVFTTMLFVVEPLILHRLPPPATAEQQAALYSRLEWLHRILLTFSLLTVAGAVAGSQGVNVFNP
jgi:uncharacterized membrane protein